MKRRTIALLTSLALVIGLMVPAGALESETSAAGSPWQDWLVRDMLTADDEVRLEDDFYTAANRDAILAYNDDPNASASVLEEREDQIADQMVALIETPATGGGTLGKDGEATGAKRTRKQDKATDGTATDKATDGTADQKAQAADDKATEDVSHDLELLRTLYDLYVDFEAREDDGVEPVSDVLDALCDVTTLDDLTEWLCSDDARLDTAWRDGVDDGYAAYGLPLFSVALYNDVDAADSKGYVVEVMAPEYSFAPFDWDDRDVMPDGKLDIELAELLRAAATTADEAYQILVHMDFAPHEAQDIVSEAAELENSLLQGDTYDVGAAAEEDASEDDAAGGPYGGEAYEELSHAELAEACKGGFPLDKILDVWGYDDANEYRVDDMDWLEHMGELYTRRNVDLFVAHALTSLALECADLLDTACYNASFDADGDLWLTDELLDAIEQEALDDAEGADGADAEDGQSDADASQLTDEEYDLLTKRSGATYLRVAAPTSFAKVYVSNFYDETTSSEVRQMVEDYVDAYEELLEGEDWISAKTRKGAMEKLQAMRIKVGHPDKWADTARLEVRGRDEGGTLFGETRRMADYDLEQERYLLRNPDEGEYWRDCMDVNAFYDTATNSVYVGVGFLGGVFWTEDGTYEERLAGVGATIGHEIGHAFDSSGAYFDKNGAYDQWWTDADLQKFEERVRRVEECFASIDAVGEGGYDGEQVSAEAIADMGGIKSSMLVAAGRKGFDYDAFFRAYARSWASVLELEDALDQLATDAHPLANHRVNVPVREVDEFYQTYDVKKGDDMWLDPADRISVW